MAVGEIILAGYIAGLAVGIAATELTCPGLAVVGGIVIIALGILELITGTAPAAVLLLTLGAGICLGPLTSSLINHVFD